MSTDLAVAGTVYARVNWNRWIADCPACPGAMKVEPRADLAECWDCGEAIGPIAWPPDPDGIAVILAMRPDPNTRNWEPGETLTDLLTENAAHGHVPPDWNVLTGAPGSQLVIMDVVGETLVGGLLVEALPSGRPRPSIGA